MCVRSAKVQAQVAAHTNHLFRARVQECVSQNDAACKSHGRKPCPLREQAESVSTHPTESREEKTVRSCPTCGAQRVSHYRLAPPVPKARVIRTPRDSWVTNVIKMSESSGTRDQAVLTCYALTTHIFRTRMLLINWPDLNHHSLFIYIYIYACMYVCMYACMYIYTSYKNACMYVCMYACMHVYIHFL